MPVRFLETTTDYRDEKTGELGGLNRVRSLTQDDSHVFARPDQIEQEINTGSQRNIGIDSLKKLSVSLPKTSEQKAIANFFKKLDGTLALQQQQFQTLKNLKQAFLEKMFV